MEEKDYMRIDPMALDEEWLTQTIMFSKYATEAARLGAEKDAAKEELDKAYAVLDRDIRMDPAKFGIDKISEARVSNTIIIQSDYIKASAKFSEARYRYELAMVDVRGMEHRKKALENLVQLFLGDYFSGPKTPKDLSQWGAAKSEKNIGQVRTRLNRTRA